MNLDYFYVNNPLWYRIKYEICKLSNKADNTGINKKISLYSAVVKILYSRLTFVWAKIMQWR